MHNECTILPRLSCYRDKQEKKSVSSIHPFLRGKYTKHNDEVIVRGMMYLGIKSKPIICFLSVPFRTTIGKENSLQWGACRRHNSQLY